jgi:aspartate 4-decarboxylase
MADIQTLKKFEALSPFEIKDELINLAKATSRTSQSAFLNAGRGNPNWIATTPREGFFLLGQFAVTESKRVMEHPAGIGGMPQANGIAVRFAAWLEKHSDMPGAKFLSEMTRLLSRNSALTATPSFTNSSIRLSATTTRFPIECWSTTNASCMSI